MLEEVGIQKKIKYPKNWKIPPPNQIPPEYRYYDVQRVISHGMIKPFMGSIEDYPRFQQSFYNMIHIQPGPIFQKVLAMDKLITDEATVAMLAGLGTSAGDYLSRIERLEQAYGGPNRLKNHHLRVLRKLEGQIDENLDNFKTYTYAVDNYLKNSNDTEAENLVLLHMLKGRMSRALRVEYNAYLQQERVTDDNQSMSLFLRNKLTTEIEAREEEAAFPHQAAKKQEPRKSTSRKDKQRGTQQVHQAGRAIRSEESSNEDDPEPMHYIARAIPLQVAAKKPNNRPKTKCLTCGSEQHFVTNCERFFVMSPDERRQLVAEKGACYICLNTTHRSKDCPNESTNAAGSAKGSTTICCHQPSKVAQNQHQWETSSVSREPTDAYSTASDSDTTQLGCAYQQARKPKTSDGPQPLDIAITYLTVWLKNPQTGVRIKVNLLADSGANSCSLDTKVGQELGLHGQAEPYHVQVGGGRINTYSAFAADVIIQGVHEGAEEYRITVHVYDKPCGSLAGINWKDKQRHWNHLKELDLPEAADRNVEGIIGMSEPKLIAALRASVTGDKHEPTATYTRLGWFVGGPVTPKANLNALSVTFVGSIAGDTTHDRQESNEALSRAMQRLWEADGESQQQKGGQKLQLTPLEERAVKVFHDTLQRLPDGRYQAGLLWRNDRPVPRNYHEALKMYYALEQQLERCPQMRLNFNKTVKEWINKSIACYVRPNQLHYFLPTFMVIRTDKATTAYRIVVDGARRFKGVSINDRLLPGPSLINHIFDVLCRFRLGRYAFTCDVQTMYLNVRVNLADRKFLGMFFREANHMPMRTLQFTSHPFGLTSSPYVAMGVVKHHAQLRRDVFPLAHQAVETSVIVDDFVVAGNDPELLHHTLTQIEALLKEVGMGTHKVAANHKGIVRNVQPDRIAKSVEIGEEESSPTVTATPTIKTLGMIWETSNDVLSLSYKPKHTGSELTLRKIVSDGGRLYDPLGIALPVAMTSRLLQQACWRMSKGWDRAVPTELADLWKKWSRKTEAIHRYKIPRSIQGDGFGMNKQRLVVFVDASSDALASVIYVQTLNSDGKLRAKLLTAKGKVTSIKKQESIPRLECAAAAMGAEFAYKAACATHFDPDLTVFFSDSMTTLWWIQSEKPLKVFVANRLCTILDHSSRKQWRYVRTDENPADMPTRTATVKRLMRSDLWNWGPEFLTRPEATWETPPQLQKTHEALMEVKELERTLEKLNLQSQTHEYNPLGKWLRTLWGKYAQPGKGLNIASYCYRAIWFHEIPGEKGNLPVSANTRSQQRYQLAPVAKGVSAGHD